jgi:hypothetical protein
MFGTRQAKAYVKMSHTRLGNDGITLGQPASNLGRSTLAVALHTLPCHQRTPGIPTRALRLGIYPQIRRDSRSQLAIRWLPGLRLLRQRSGKAETMFRIGPRRAVRGSWCRSRNLSFAVAMVFSCSNSRFFVSTVQAVLCSETRFLLRRYLAFVSRVYSSRARVSTMVVLASRVDNQR